MLTSVCSTSNCVAFFNKVYFIEGQKPYWPQSRKKITNNHKMQSKKSWFFRRNIKLEWWYIPLFHKPTEEATSNQINLFLPNLTMPCKLSRKFPRLIEKRLSGLSSIKRILENLKDYHEQRRITQKENKEINPKYRKGSILWFIPSYRKSVKTNILKLVFKKLFLHYQNQIFMYSQHQIKNYYTQQN